MRQAKVPNEERACGYEAPKFERPVLRDKIQQGHDPPAPNRPARLLFPKRL